MKTKQLFTFFMALAAFNTFAQTVITVDNSVGANADYDDLQTAISLANDNDIIYVHASEMSYGNININKPLKLIGFGHSNPDKNTYVDFIFLDDGSSNTTISGFYVNDDIYSYNNTVQLTNIIIENNVIDSQIYFFSGAGGSNVVIHGNIIYIIGTSSSAGSNYTNTLITNNVITNYINVYYHESVTIKNNIFLNTSHVNNLNDVTGDLAVQNCIFYTVYNNNIDYNRDGVFFENCMTYNSLSTTTNLVGTGNINDVNPDFVAAVDGSWDGDIDDYHLQAGSLASGAGVGGEDLGIYDGVGPFVFNNFGYTDGIPSVTITAITEQVAPGDNVEVTIQSNSN